MKLWDTAKHWGLWIQWELCWPMAWKCKKFCYILYRKTLSGDTLTFRLMLFDIQTNAQGGTLVTEFLEVKSFFFVKNKAPNNGLLLKTFVDEEKSLRILIPENPTKKKIPQDTSTLQKTSQDSMTLKRRSAGLKSTSRQLKISDSKDFHRFCCEWCYEDLRVSEVLLKVMLYEDLGVFQVLLSVKLWRSQDLLWRSQSVGRKSTSGFLRVAELFGAEFWIK